MRRPMEALLSDRESFLKYMEEWKSADCDHSFPTLPIQHFQQYCQRYKEEHGRITCSFDWIAYEPKNSFGSKGWESASKLPRWLLDLDNEYRKVN